MKNGTRVPVGRMAGAMLALFACETPGVLTPQTGPNTSYPCGVNGEACEGATDAHPICCGQGFVCCDKAHGNGTSSVCPAGMCEWFGDEIGPTWAGGARMADGGPPDGRPVYGPTGAVIVGSWSSGATVPSSTNWSLVGVQGPDGRMHWIKPAERR
jgi:hypothetical protein